MNKSAMSFFLTLHQVWNGIYILMTLLNVLWQPLVSYVVYTAMEKVHHISKLFAMRERHRAKLICLLERGKTTLNVTKLNYDKHI